MRAFRFSLFLATMAGALSAAAYLWTPLVSPSTPQVHLAAPSLRSSVLEPPLRIPPLAFIARPLRLLLPLHAAGTALVHLPHVAPQEVARRVVPVAPAPVPAAPVVVHHSVAPPAPKVVPGPPTVTELPIPAVHVAPAAPAAARPAKPAKPKVVLPAPKPAPAPAPLVAAPAVATPTAPGSQPATNAPAAPPPAATAAPTPEPAAVTPPPTPTPSEDTSRPGWGCGDKNHDHAGPSNGQSSPCK
jgi:outer membrane biosynthesis protein TonB